MGISRVCRNGHPGNYDSNELINGYCEECWQKRQKVKKTNELMQQMIKTNNFKQMEMEEFLK